ncbi:MAG: enoyl-[acyl-carrier protein] reductase [Gaiellales bacterium]|jgi:enoyl-[acyl-carrier protein] reductase III|nr:enoyl-[acyl-carrier protein] reductase [Gaiellales bacterium]
MRLAGRLALVTGGARGIGRATCLQLAREGADVAIGYVRNEDAANETKRLVEAEGRRALLVKGHLGDADHVSRVVDAAVEGLGGLDLVVSNAASGVIRPAMEVTARHWDWTLDINARAFLLLAQRAVPHLEARGGGSLVAISSLGAGRTLPNYVLVGTSKAALESLVRYLGVELAGRGIRVNGVSGGVVETDALEHFENREQMLRNAREHTPAGRILQPEDLARVVAFLCTGDADMIVGQILVVDGGYGLPAMGEIYDR